MKKFKEFKSEQQYIAEIGPIAATLMGAMALWGGYQAFKKVKEKVKGYRETKQEKKDNKKAGVSIELKKFNSETGKMDVETEMIAKPGTSDAAMSADDIAKEQKKRQKKLDAENTRLKNAYQEKEKGAKEKRGGIEDVEDAEEYFKNKGKAPTGWADTRTDKEKEDGVDFKGKIMTRADAAKEKKRQRKVGTIGRGGKDTSKPAPAETESTMLKFGEFITEDVIKDLKKIIKSKKDSEIELDDGSEIPIDPVTAEIFVKYIEGLGSSEKNKTIKQIQRTERGFMKVLGKAHEE